MASLEIQVVNIELSKGLLEQRGPPSVALRMLTREGPSVSIDSDSVIEVHYFLAAFVPHLDLEDAGVGPVLVNEDLLDSFGVLSDTRQTGE